MKKQLFSVLSFLMLCIGVQAQTTLISPTGDGGFENGATLASNGWTAVNGTTNTWNVGTAAFASGANSAYISNNSGVSYTYSNTTAAVAHFYRDVTFPAGETVINFSFKLRGDGDIFSGTYYDKLMVFSSPTTFTPTTASPVSSGTVLAGATLIYAQAANFGGAYVTISGTLPANFAGTTQRLIFTWHNDASAGTVPSSVDDISLTSRLPGNFISIASGNWTNPTTWDANAVPTAADNVTVTATHTVALDVNNQAAKDLTVNGSLTYSATPAAFGIAGNLLVSATGNLLAFNGTTGKTLSVIGNITNDGTIDLSKTGSILNLIGTSAQTINGSGTLTNGSIGRLVFNNTATVPTINWNWLNTVVSGTLTMTSGRINLGSTNKMTLGTALTTGNNGTLTYTSGGFLNGTFSRWWTNGGTGSATSAGTDPTTATSRYPFINASGINRAAYIERTTPTAGGQYSIKYTDAATTSASSIVDGTYTVQTVFDGSWVVGTEGTTPAAASHALVLLAPGSYVAANGNSRIVGASAILGGTHRNGTATPGAQRTGLTLAELTSGPAYIGANTADILAPCSGAPTAGTAAASSTSICSATNFSLTLTGSTTGVTGITYQWQSSPDGTTWTNIASATSTLAVVSQTAATYYQALVTCTVSASTATTNVIQVGMNNFLACYCITSPSTGGVNDIVTNVNVTNSLGQNLTQASTSSTIAPAYFVSYTNTPLDLVQGSISNTVSITYGSDGTQYGAAWIDFNRNGIYETSENVGLATISSGGNSTVTYTFTVPMGASLGNTRLRVRGGSDGAYTAAGACNTTAYGETEDYLVNIITPPTCFAPTALTTTNVATMTTDLSWTAPTLGTPANYNWEVRTSGAAGSGTTGLVTSGNVIAPTSSVAISGLTPITSYSVYVRSDCGAGDFSTWSAVKTFTTLANCPVPTGVTVANTATTAVATWTAGGTETAWDVYYGVSPLTVPTATTVATATTSSSTFTLTGINPSTGYSFYVRANCGSGNMSIWTPVSTFTTPCLPPNILTANGSTRCGNGTATLTATSDAGVINWYNAATGGTSIATGTVFTTPTISNTTTYYAEAGNPSIVSENAGPSVITASSTTNSNYGDHGIVFTTTKNNVSVVSSKLYINGSGAITISLRNSAGTEISNTGTISVVGNGSVTPLVIPINLTTTTPGSYQLILKSATGITSICHQNTPVGYPFTSPSGNVSITSGYWYGNDPAHRYFYDVNFQYSDLCASTRTAVTATVNTAPVLSVTSGTTICANVIKTLNVTSTLSDYDSYVWSPVANLYTDAAATTPYTGGSASTLYYSSATINNSNYTVNSSNTVSGCVNTTSVGMSVTIPSIVASANPTIVCSGASVNLNATGIAAATGTIAVGNATTVTTATGELTAFCNRRVSYRMQSVYTAAELTALGLSSGNITSIAYNITTIGDAATNALYTVKMGTTSVNAFTDFISNTGFTTVFNPATYTHSVGINTINFNTPYAWDGVSNIAIEVTHDGIDNINNAQTYYTATTGNMIVYSYDGNTTGTPSLNRLNIIINGQKNIDNTANYTWQWNPGAVNSNTTTVIATNTGSTTTTESYTVTALDPASTCTNSAVVTLSVVPVPTVAASVSSASICSGNSATLTATGATTYSWSNSVNTATQNVSPAVTSIYTVTGTTNGCSNTATVSLNVTASPTVIASTTSNSLCSGNSATLTASGATNYTWTSGGNTSTEVVSPSTTTTYTVTGESTGCTSASTVAINVTTTPTVAATASSATICTGNSATLTASGATNYTWTSGGTTATENVTPTALTVYTVTGETSGCSSTATVSVDVNSIIPTVTISASSASVCSGSSATLTAGGATNYTWTSGGTTSTEVVTPTTLTVYTVTGVTSGCSNTATISLAVNQSPTVTAVASQTLLCDDGSTGSSMLTASSNGTTYLWSDGATTMTTVVTPSATTVYTITATGNGCSTDAYVTVTVSNCNGIKDLTANEISIFPNPTNGIVTISIPAVLEGNVTVEVYDAIGKLTIKENITNNMSNVNLSKLEDGMYMFKIINNNKAIKIGKIVKQ